jgi:nucleoside-diphosphate-sugar epimerase
MNNVFITGATGYIGSKLALKLATNGDTIHALCRSNSKNRYLDHPNIKFFPGDICNRESVLKAMNTCRYVYHLAAYVSAWAKKPQTYTDINIRGTEIILETALKQGIEKTLFTSSAGVFGPTLKGLTDEKSTVKIDSLTDYGNSKAAADRKVQFYIGKGLKAVIVYPTRVFGPGLLTESNSITKIIHFYIRNKFGFIPGNGKNIGNYAFIDDVVDGHLLAMRKGKSGEKYILGGSNISFNDFFNKLSIVTGKKHILVHIPKWAMLSFAKSQELMANSFGKKPLITRKWVRKSLYNWILTSRKAKQELGYGITPFEEGITQTVKWIMDKN